MTSDTIAQYQEQRNQLAALREKARKEMVDKFGSLLTEAAQIAAMYKEDFGSVLAPPEGIVFKVTGEIKTKTGRRKNAAAATEAPANPSGLSNKKIAGLRRRVDTLSSLIASRKADGKNTQKQEDELYQIQDELRLAGALETTAPAEQTQAQTPEPVAATAEVPEGSLQAPQTSPFSQSFM